MQHLLHNKGLLVEWKQTLIEPNDLSGLSIGDAETTGLDQHPGQSIHLVPARDATGVDSLRLLLLLLSVLLQLIEGYGKTEQPINI